MCDKKKLEVQVKIVKSTFEPIEKGLDPKIKRYVNALRIAGIETCQSCQGGKGHVYPEPTIEFWGDRSEGFKALAITIQQKMPVKDLKRVWSIEDREPTGPVWELIFWKDKL